MNRLTSGHRGQSRPMGVRTTSLALVLVLSAGIHSPIFSQEASQASASESQATDSETKVPGESTKPGPVQAEQSAVEPQTRPGDETENERDAAETSKDPETVVAADPIDAGESTAELSLPLSLPDGRRIRPVGIYESQMYELIPDDYRPVPINRLRSAIARLADRRSDGVNSRLRSATYWIELNDDRLVSRRSTIEIESDRAGIIRHPLGRVNLALEQPTVGGGSVAEKFPRLETKANGQLIALAEVSSQSLASIDFQWQSRGRVLGSGHEFSLRIPATPQTRIVLSTPQDVSVEAIDGVLRLLPAPPPDAAGISEATRWYEIEAGGLDLVRLRTEQKSTLSGGREFIVRETSMQYRADPSGVGWTCRMLIQPSAEANFPPLHLPGTTVTSAKVNATEVPFTFNDETGELQVDVPGGIVDPQIALANVLVSGYTTWPRLNGWCALPLPRWIGNRVVQASIEDQAELSVVGPLQCVDWQLPETWRRAMPRVAEDGTIILVASGPPVDDVAKSDPSTQDRGGRQDLFSWSRARFANQSTIRRSNTDLRLKVNGGSLEAAARVVLDVESGRIEPIAMRIQPGWNVASISFATSGRVLENIPLQDTNRTVNIWPEADDLEDSQLVLEVVATRLLTGGPDGLTIPPTWLTRVPQTRGTLLAAIMRPTSLNWSGEAAMECLPTAPDDLTAAQQKFFANADDETLWFRPLAGRTPAVSLQPPTVAYDTVTLLQVTRDGRDIVEHLAIEIDSPGQSLNELSVQTGPARGRPPLNWSLSGVGDSPATSLPPSDIQTGNTADGIYTLNVADTTLRGRQLIARRRYPLASKLELQLPSVPGASSQRSEVQISGGLLVERKDRAVERIPMGDLSEAIASNSTPPETVSATNHSASFGRITRLRYDAVEQPSITLAASDVDANVTMVWQEQIRMVASSRGTDLVEATFEVSSAVPIKIDYGVDLQLTSVHRDDKAVELSSIPPHPIVLEPRGGTETIRVRWNRSEYQSDWLRHCRLPEIRISGVVLSSDYQLIPATDTFAPASLLRGEVSETTGATTVETTPAGTVLLLRRNIALAFGWLIALIVFALGWYIAERSPTAIAMSVAILSAVVFLWWPWRIAVIGWLMIPLLSSAMLAAAHRWQIHNSTLLASEDSPSSRRSVRNSENDLSFTSAARLLLLALVAAGSSYAGLAQRSVAQERSQRSALAATTVNLFIPVNQHGQRTGEMVYIPTAFYQELFSAAGMQGPEDVAIQAADYEVQLTTPSGSGSTSEVSVEAIYLVRLMGDRPQGSQLRIPIPAASVRRIERLNESSQLIQFRPDRQGQTIAVLPAGNDFRLRLTLVPSVSQQQPWTKVLLPIPPVASTRLSVESDANLDAVRVGGPAGVLLAESDLRRWTEPLGPVDSLEIDFRRSDATAADQSPLGRRYWIRANAEKVSIDCEVDPPLEHAAGETFQFIIRDSRMPILTSSAWRLDRSEQYTPARRLITVTSTRDSPGPVRLLWTEPVGLSADTEEPVSIRIPEVIAAALGENAPAWIGLHTDWSSRFLPLSRESTEALAVDHFLAAWTGYRGDIDTAMVALDELPAPVIEKRSPTTPVAGSQHDLRVNRDRLELHYTATIIPQSNRAERFSLRFPRSLRLELVELNGETLEVQPVSGRDRSELVLGYFQGTDPISVRVVAIKAINTQRNATFTPPMMELTPAEPSSGVYLLSRDQSVHLHEVKAPPVPGSSLPEDQSKELFVRGWIPVAMWSTEPGKNEEEIDLSGVRYRVTPQPTSFDCRQLISLRRQEQQWQMDVRIGIESSRQPEFIDVELPTAWCDSLTVQPTGSLLTRRPATDDSRQIVRIRHDRAAINDGPLVIQGKLQNPETGRVNVPSVKVLGNGLRQIFIDLPTTLNDETIQWRTSAVEAIELPDSFRMKSSTGPHSSYVVANRSWSIELAPLSQDDSGAIVFSADSQVFSTEEGLLVMGHWDLYPGGLESVRIDIPAGATCRGAWTAGRAVIPQPVDGDSESPATQLRVPLSLSRLSQPVEVLLSIPSQQASQGNYLPKMLGATAKPSWIAHYVSPQELATRTEASREAIEARAIELAQGTIDAIAAVSTAVQRPRDEIASWLQLWISRYELTARSAGHTVQWDQIANGLVSPPPILSERQRRSIDEGQSLPSHLQWKQLDAELAAHVERLLPQESASAELLGDIQPQGPLATATAVSFDRATQQQLFLFGAGRFEGFVPHRVQRLQEESRPAAIVPVSQQEAGLRRLLVHSLTLLLVIGLLFCLRPLRHRLMPLLQHPALWMGLVGLFSIPVAPLPVAAAVLLVAITLTAFPSRPRFPRLGRS